MKRIVGTLLTTLTVLGAAASAQNTVVGDWLYLERIDPFTDEDKSFISVSPIQPSASESDYFGIACMPGFAKAYGVNVAFMGSSYIADDATEVTYRVDSKPAVTQRWGAYDVLVSPEPAFAKALIDQMLGGEKLALRYQASSSRPTYFFSIKGLREALNKLSCYTGPM